MSEEKYDDISVLLKKVEEFEVTISQLIENVKKFKSKLLDKKKKYGTDMTKWPEEKQANK